jgi:hypothetical protein
MNTSKAIYFQQASDWRKNHEFELVRQSTRREAYLFRLVKLTRDVNSMRRKCDDQCILETFSLLNALRESTLDFGEALETWHLDFTKVVRPQILGSDYICEMTTKQEPLQTLRMRKLFSFQFRARNILLLPLTFTGPEVQTERAPLVISAQLAEQMRRFAEPNEERVVRFYRMLQKFMPRKVFENILPLSTWYANRWIAPKATLDIHSQSSSLHSGSILPPINGVPQQQKRTGAKSKSPPHSPTGSISPLDTGTAACTARTTATHDSEFEAEALRLGRGGYFMPIGTGTGTSTADASVKSTGSGSTHSRSVSHSPPGQLSHRGRLAKQISAQFRSDQSVASASASVRSGDSNSTRSRSVASHSLAPSLSPSRQLSRTSMKKSASRKDLNLNLSLSVSSRGGLSRSSSKRWGRGKSMKGKGAQSKKREPGVPTLFEDSRSQGEDDATVDDDNAYIRELQRMFIRSPTRKLRDQLEGLDGAADTGVNDNAADVHVLGKTRPNRSSPLGIPTTARSKSMKALPNASHMSVASSVRNSPFPKPLKGLRESPSRTASHRDKIPVSARSKQSVRREISKSASPSRK